jgi:hypothetical protein
MAASRAGGPRRGAREVYEQGEDPLYIPPVDAPTSVAIGELL